MKNTVIVTALIILFIAGCCKEKVATNNTPYCIIKKISDNDKSNLELSKIDQYTFQGKTVFTLAPDENIADGATEVVDENCNTLGILGGLKGFTQINGEEFSNAVFIKNIWKK